MSKTMEQIDGVITAIEAEIAKEENEDDPGGSREVANYTAGMRQAIRIIRVTVGIDSPDVL